MSFFKEFKEDFSQAVNELMPGEDAKVKEDDLVVNTLEQEVDARAEMNKLEGLFERVDEPIIARTIMPEPTVQKVIQPQPVVVEEPIVKEPVIKETLAEEPVLKEEPVVEAVKTEEPIVEAVKAEEPKEDIFMNTEVKETVEETVKVQPVAPSLPKEVSEEIAIITAGTVLTGNMESTGSIEIRGQVNGNVQCNGKLTVTGVVKGNSIASEFFADSARVEGEIKTDGTVKIGLGSVVVGNIEASSAVIAGAIKGDIDVHGPVVVDTSAVVMGNIKSRSVQINNGAVIEGFCSQCYAEVDVAKLFDGE